MVVRVCCATVKQMSLKINSLDYSEIQVRQLNDTVYLPT